MFWSFFVLGLVKWRVGHVLAYPGHQEVQASALLALVFNLGYAESPWFLFLQTCIFSPVTRDVPSHVEQQLLGTVWTFMPLYSKWAIPEQCLGLSLWRDLRVWIFQPKEDIAPAVGLFSHRECHCHGLVWVCSCDTWSPTHHSGCKDGVSSLKRNTITCALQYSPWWIYPSRMSGADSW